MAKFTVTGLDDVQEAMLRRDKATMEAVPEMLKAGGEVIKSAFQAETSQLNSTGRGTGDLTASIKVSATAENTSILRRREKIGTGYETPKKALC